MQDTPFGNIPDDWGLDTINDACEVVTDYVANGSFKSLADNVVYQDHEDSTVLIRLVDYNNGFNGNFVYVNDHAYEFLAKSKLFGDEIIISNVGANVGTVFRCPHLDKQMTLGPNSVMLKFKQNDDFYFYWLKSPAGQHMLQSIVTGSAQPKFNKTNLRQVIIPVPPEDVQKKIADILLSIDNKIDNNNQINRNLSEQAQAIYESWFVSSEKFGGVVPLDWEEGVLGDIAEIKTTSFKPDKEPDVIVEHYSIPALDEKHFPVFELAEGIKSNKYLLNKNSVMISKLNPDTKRIWRPLCLSDKPVCSTEFIVFEAKNKKNKDFIFSILDSDKFSNHLCSHVTGSTGSRQRAVPKATLDFKVLIPPQELIEQFCSIVTPIYDSIGVNEIENQRLSELRDSLLPKLMSGELDVSDLDI